VLSVSINLKYVPVSRYRVAVTALQGRALNWG
jgi:hypothetical protein